MRHYWKRVVAALAVAASAMVMGGASAAASAVAETYAWAAEPYTWRNAQIGGGGFVPGIIFSRAEKDLIYARTDIGGAYRWDAGSERWIPLLDSIGWDDWGWTGVASLATDPVDPDRVYAAVGTYTNDWDPNNGAILRSHDRGANWEAAELPFKLGGNMPGRGMGERLAVDPNDNDVLYFGAPSGRGLWRSTDAGRSWAEVENFPNPGNYVQDPGDETGYLSDNQGVVWVTFDKSSGSAGSPTRTIYVGVADKENTVYRTTDGGRSWERVPGQPQGYLAHKGVLDEENGVLYIATSDTGGPYDGGKGDVWRFDTGSEEWTRISPVPSDSADAYFGYSGLTIDRQNPGTIMVATQISWWPDAIFFRSTDGGESWTRIWDFESYPNRSKRYAIDVSAVPWLTFGANPQPPEETPKLGWMNESVEIDPFDPDRMMYGTGATIYGTTDLTDWDNDQQITIRPMVRGLEETAVNDLISPPEGAPLLSALGDIGGFRHDDLDVVPELMFTSPNLTNTTSLDFAERNPAVIARVGSIDRSQQPNVNRFGVSADGGRNWWQGQEPPGVTGGGTVAVAADGGAFVWSPQGAPVHVSTDYGSSWTRSEGIPDGAIVESDRSNPETFYGFTAGRFYVSVDGGATFTPTGAAGLPGGGNVRFKAVPGREGDVWLAGGSGDTYGLWHSTDGGETFARIANADEADTGQIVSEADTGQIVSEADTIGFGRAAEGRDYPALYTSARIGGVRGIFRSDDAGESWARINDDDHQWGWTGAAITGDPRVHGRVYVSTNGRGVIVGDVAGGNHSDRRR